MTPKTRKEWFSLLPPDVEKMALENTRGELHTKSESMLNVLTKSFVWRNTPQGYDFWNAIANDEKYK